MATSEQRRAFGQALQRARRECGMSQRQLGAAIGVSQASVSQWVRGHAAPKPERVAKLERILQLESNSLARLLGYGPLDNGDWAPVMTVQEAADADRRLGERERHILAAVYRELVQQRQLDLAGPDQATRA